MDRSLGFSSTSLLLMMMLVAAELFVHPAMGVPNKCAACQAVAEEIESGLANERPRNHLDLRHRLDSKGQREGKVIDYKVSELRVVELLEGLCSKFSSHTIKKGVTDTEEWVKVETELLSNIERQEAQSYSKQLVSYCGSLLEATEDELTRKIQKGEVKAGDVESVLCVELSKHCNLLKEADVNFETTGGSDGEL